MTLSLLIVQLLNGLQFGVLLFLVAAGLTLVFGVMDFINLAHGVQYMLGAYVAWMLLSYLGIGFWGALVVAPLVVALLGMALERGLLRYLRDVDQIYGLLLTFGVALILEGLVAQTYGWASSAMWTLMPQLERLLKIPDPHIHLGTDFGAARTQIEGEAGVVFRIGDLLIIGLGFGIPLLKWLRKRKKEIEQSVKAAPPPAQEQTAS